jgi:hypothetical protein
MEPDLASAESLPPQQPAPPRAAGLGDWLREGGRAGLLLKPRVEGQRPRPRHLLAIVALIALLEIGLSRFEVAGTADFELRAWLAPWWGVAASVLLVWAVLWGRTPAPGRLRGLDTWFALWLVAGLLTTAVSQAIAIAHGRHALPPVLLQSATFAWGVYLLMWVWTIAIALRLGWHFGLARRPLVALAAGMVAIFGVSAWQFPDRPWTAPLPSLEDHGPRLVLSQEAFEAQQQTWRKAVDGLARERPGVVDVYGLVFAPYAAEDVFLRESTMVAEVLAQRFDAQGRVLHLVNHVRTASSHPWATPLNLQRAIEAIGERMNRDEDVLVVYLTSHGAQNFRLAAEHGPLQVEPLSPSELRTALDEARIRHRVIAISACYSGGWVGPLGGDRTLVMAAASADRTSYGCGKLSELTFFGRAVFDEQLRKTRSFEQAFAAAVPVIKQREQEAGKPDGFSNPQIAVGEGIRPVLRTLEQRLEAAARP